MEMTSDPRTMLCLSRDTTKISPIYRITIFFFFVFGKAILRVSPSDLFIAVGRNCLSLPYMGIAPSLNPSNK